MRDLVTVSSVAFVLGLILVSYITYSNGQENIPLRTFRGIGNFTTYTEGNSPIIILSLNDGSMSPDNIPDRSLGCWESSESCIFEYDCADTYGLQENCTDETVIQNDGTSLISQCLFENIKLLGQNSRPHYIKNNLDRYKIDTNTPKTGDDSAALKNAYLWQPGAPEVLSDIWDEIWTKWVPKAKNATTKQCGWGFLFDVHGYPDKGSDQLGYFISEEDLGKDNKGINQIAGDSSLKTLVGTSGVNLTDLIKGPNSIGTIMNEQFGWDILPSRERPGPAVNEKYYSGGWSLKITTTDGFVSAVQIEISEIVKLNVTKSQRYCRDLAQAITQFVSHFYNITGCSGYSTPNTAEPAAITPNTPTTPTTAEPAASTPSTPSTPYTPTTSVPAPEDGSGSESKANKVSITFFALISSMTFMYYIF